MNTFKIIGIALLSLVVLKSFCKICCGISCCVKLKDMCKNFTCCNSKKPQNCHAKIIDQNQECHNHYSCGCANRFPLWRILFSVIIFSIMLKFLFACIGCSWGNCNSCCSETKNGETTYKMGSMKVIINSENKQIN